MDQRARESLNIYGLINTSRLQEICRHELKIKEKKKYVPTVLHTNNNNNNKFNEWMKDEKKNYYICG